jgi:signal transduction histidine kinase
MGTPERPSKRVPTEKAREATDAHLASERDHADRELKRKLARGERRTDVALAQTRDETSATVASAAQRADQAVKTPSEQQHRLDETVETRKEELQRARGAADAARAALEETRAVAERAVEAERVRAEQAVQRVTEQANEAMERERAQADALTEEERDRRKLDFLEVLAAERRKTDDALFVERDSSDFSVRSRDDVLAVISHDLRNYLHVVALKAKLLKRAAAAGNRAAMDPLIAAIVEACGTMGRWAGDLVDLSSLEAGQIRLQPAPCKAADLLQRAREAFAPLADQRGIRLEVHGEDGELEVHCDRDRLAQVFHNLLDNALKFTPRGGRVRIEARRSDADAVLFSVGDSGPGIPEAELPHVFERFWHGRKSRAGGGLGLYITRRIVEAHRGKTWIESKAGEGTTFFFTLPVG